MKNVRIILTSLLLSIAFVMPFIKIECAATTAPIHNDADDKLIKLSREFAVYKKLPSAKLLPHLKKLEQQFSATIQETLDNASIAQRMRSEYQLTPHLYDQCLFYIPAEANSIGMPGLYYTYIINLTHESNATAGLIHCTFTLEQATGHIIDAQWDLQYVAQKYRSAKIAYNALQPLGQRIFQAFDVKKFTLIPAAQDDATDQERLAKGYIKNNKAQSTSSRAMASMIIKVPPLKSKL